MQNHWGAYQVVEHPQGHLKKGYVIYAKSQDTLPQAVQINADDAHANLHQH